LFAQNLRLVNILHCDDLSHVSHLKFYFILFVQPYYDAEPKEFKRGLLPMDISDSNVPSGHYPSCCCVEHMSRIADLEGRLSLFKRQAKTTMDQAGKSFGLMKEVSSLKTQVSDLMAKIIHVEECDAFLI
jgi:hypothetical protein